jgi:hypothetical protein
LVQEYVENLTEAIQEPKSVINKKYKAADLQQQYKKEIERNKSYFTLDAAILKNYFTKIQDTITNINYEKISLEFTPDSSFFFNILINTKIKAHIEIYLEDTSDIMKEAFFNIFENRRSIKSGFGKIIDIVREINFY